MKVRAIVQFEDYKENTTRKIGDIFEVTKERLEEILTKGGNWVEVINDTRDDKTEEKESENKDISTMKKSELEKLAKEKGLKVDKTMTKEDLIKLIEEV